MSIDQRITVVTTKGDGRPSRSIAAYEVAVTRGPDRGLRRVLSALRTRVGALPGNEVQLTDPEVSGHHAELVVEPDGLRLRDLGSRNGIFVGGCRVLDAILPSPAQVELGVTELSIQAAGSSVDLPASQAPSFGPLVGDSLAMRELYAQLEAVSRTSSTVLISGETGTGKEVVAEAIVAAGERAAGPMVVVDCGALAPTLVEAELFGHEKGAFTGAGVARPGVFERAGGGTVFLDEIGELPLELQPKLLRVLERREVQRLGGAAPTAVDVRVLAATHRQLEVEVNRGAFRADLFYRISVLRVHVPPLRERAGDVPRLVQHMLAQLGSAMTLQPEVVARLTAHSWPGNVRELRNAVERLAAGAPPLGPPSPAQTVLGTSIDLDVPYLAQKNRLVADFERRYAEALVAAAGGNLAEAARRAGITRMAVVKLLDRLGLQA